MPPPLPRTDSLTLLAALMKTLKKLKPDMRISVMIDQALIASRVDTTMTKQAREVALRDLQAMIPGELHDEALLKHVLLLLLLLILLLLLLLLLPPVLKEIVV